MKTKSKKHAKAAKRKVITREVWTKKYEGVLIVHEKSSEKRGQKVGLCEGIAAGFFDLRGMKPGDVRRFKIKTEVLE